MYVDRAVGNEDNVHHFVILSLCIVICILPMTSGYFNVKPKKKIICIRLIVNHKDEKRPSSTKLKMIYKCKEEKPVWCCECFKWYKETRKNPDK